MVVLSGGTSVDTTFAGSAGGETVSSGGVAISTIVSSSNAERVAFGGTYGATVSSGGTQFDLGTASGTTLAHGVQWVSSGGGPSA